MYKLILVCEEIKLILVCEEIKLIFSSIKRT